MRGMVGLVLAVTGAWTDLSSMTAELEIIWYNLQVQLYQDLPVWIVQCESTSLKKFQNIIDFSIFLNFSASVVNLQHSRDCRIDEVKLGVQLETRMLCRAHYGPAWKHSIGGTIVVRDEDD